MKVVILSEETYGRCGMWEELIVRHCSTTLAGLKTGSLFSCAYVSEGEVTRNIRKLNQRLMPKGLRVLPARMPGKRVLVYIYRPKKLMEDFSEPSVRMILEEYGYSEEKPDLCVARLIKRLQSEGRFPHEIGLFLGYPAEDVRGFIQHKAQDSKCVGYWKVYGDEASAKKLFEKYRECTDTYCRQWKDGKSMEQLTVAG